MSLLDIVLIVAGVGYVLVRRMAGSLLEVKGLLILPVVLTVVGLTSLRRAAPIDAGTVAFLALGVLVSVGLGLLRGTTIHLGERDGELWMRYTARSVGLWVLNIALKGLFVPVEIMLSAADAHAAERGILLSIGLGILAESAVVVLRAMRSRSDLVWEKGENGAPHRGLPALERVREVVAGGGPARQSLRRGLGLGDRDW